MGTASVVSSQAFPCVSAPIFLSPPPVSSKSQSVPTPDGDSGPELPSLTTS